MPGGGLIWKKKLRCSAVRECSDKNNIGDICVSHMNLYFSKRRLWDIMMGCPGTVKRTWIFPKWTRYTKWVTTVREPSARQIDVSCIWFNLYIYVFMCIHMYIYIYIYIYVCVCIYIYKWMYNQFRYIMFTDMYTYTHTYINLFHIYTDRDQKDEALALRSWLALPVWKCG